jgi:hypothetical protein
MANGKSKSKIRLVKDETPPPTAVTAGSTSAEPMSIPKPKGKLDRFKSKSADTIANVATLLEALPVHSLAQANDFVRLHPNEEDFWSVEFCFVSVPIKGTKKDTLHLIDEEIAMRFLPSGKIKRFRLALATKPNDVFFLAALPTRNLDNSWNESVLLASEKAKVAWIEVSSRKAEGVDQYKITFARDPDAFPEPKWPKASLEELIDKAFAGRQIDREDHPALLRLIGAKQTVS